VTDRFRVVPAAYVVFRREHEGRAQVLLQLRRGTGYMDGFWATAAAGHVEADESVLEAACRESAEELGVTVHEDDLVPLCGMHRTGGQPRPDRRAGGFFLRGPQLARRAPAGGGGQGGRAAVVAAGRAAGTGGAARAVRARPAPRRRPGGGRDLRLLSRPRVLSRQVADGVRRHSRGGSTRGRRPSGHRVTCVLSHHWSKARPSVGEESAPIMKEPRRLHVGRQARLDG
jgi:NUDIX domain